MSWEYSPYALFLLIAAAVLIILALYAWYRRTTRGATMFTILMFVVAEMALGNALELGSADLSTKILWAKLQYIGIVSIPVAWLLFALAYTGRTRWLTRRTVAFLLAIPATTLSLAWTNEAHNLIWQSLELVPDDPFLNLTVRYGAWFWVHTLYSYLLLLLGSSLLIRRLLHGPRLYRQQSITLLIGVAAPLLFNILYLFNASPVPHLDLTPFAFTLSGLAFAWSLFGFRLLDVTPVARDAIFEHIYAGVIVLDRQRRILDFNPAAQQFFSQLGPHVVGHSLADIMPELVAQLPFGEETGETRASITFELDLKPRFFELTFSYLFDHNGQTAGCMIVLRDMTDYQETRAELEESEERYRTVSELTSDFTYALRVDPDGNLDADWMTDAFFRITEYTAEEVKQRGGWRWLVHPDDRLMTALYGRRLYLGRTEIAEFRIVSKSGQTIWIRNYGKPQVNEAGQVVRILGAGQNVTEQKRVEAALRESEERYRLLFDNSPNPMWVYDQQTLAFLATNEAAVHAYGYTRDEFLRMRLPDLLPEVSDKSAAQDRSSGDRLRPVEGVWQHRKKNGAIIDVEVRSHGLNFGGREAQVILANDITARRQAERALRESEERYRRLVEYSPEPIAVHSEGKLVYVNAAAVGLYGARSRDELLGQSVLNLIHPDYRDVAVIRDQHIYEAGQPAELIEEKIIRLDGQSIDAEIATIPTTYLGKPALQLVARDITARKRVEETLRQQNEYFAALHDTMLAVMNRLEVQDVLEAIVVRAGALVGTEHGYLYSGEAGSGTGEVKVAVGVFRSSVGSQLRPGVGFDGTVWLTGQPLVVNNYQEWCDQLFDEAHMNLHAVVGLPLTSGSEVVGVLGLAHLEPGRSFGDSEIAILTRFAELASIALDNARLYTTAQQELAERKHAEEKLALARDQALEAARLKSEFLATMSHELRTPLNAIIGFTDLTLEPQIGPLNDQQRSNLQRVSRNARNLLELIDGILDVSKIDAGHMQINIEPVLLSEVVIGAVSNIETLVMSKQLEVTIQQPPRPLPLVYGDSGRLRQIVLNLLSNAVKFTPARGRIVVVLESGLPTTLATAALPAEGLPVGDWIALSVQDTGIGIPPDEQARIWSEFYQIDGSTTRQYGGTGLGLAIVRRLTQLMGGRVGIHSVVGAGSTFTVWLPVASGAVAEDASSEVGARRQEAHS
jgi:PAS domain S-box-containing protein